MEYGILGIIILILDIYAVVQVISSSASGGSKILWILGILIFPVLGFIVWAFAGPRGGRAAI
ncbi:PLD nuclease N-terminal domain-containing protein [Pseudovibrio exalbescens]|uniref:PLD nuclease N-terminal domain-containing protein n=1 Tax=Pseudovibrio exalbescens TaxID=197461 RepID=UPI000C9CD800|nr:PLD nuclease N-terminal domain-containing protein [Pseudovibrio exalbescens]